MRETLKYSAFPLPPQSRDGLSRQLLQSSRGAFSLPGLVTHLDRIALSRESLRRVPASLRGANDLCSRINTS